AETVAVGLRRAQMAVDVAFDGPSGLERALATDYDVIVLDRDLPGLHGDEVCAELIATRCRSRVLMLTAAAANEDIVDGLGPGAGRLPAQALRLPGAGGRDRRPGSPGASRCPAGAPARRPGRRHGAAPCLAGGQAVGPVAEGVRGPGAAGRRAGTGRPCGGVD